MPSHTPEPCGCYERLSGEIRYCPTHAAAPEMLAELRTVQEDINTLADHTRIWHPDQMRKHMVNVQLRISALLSRVERS